jgi:hypothetical protein
MKQAEKQKCINTELMEGTTKKFPRHGQQGLVDGVKCRGGTPRCLTSEREHEPSCYRQSCCKGHGHRTRSSTPPPRQARGRMCNSYNPRHSMTAPNMQAEQDPPVHTPRGADPRAKNLPLKTPSLKFILSRTSTVWASKSRMWPHIATIFAPMRPVARRAPP